MSATEQLQTLADFLFELLTSRPPGAAEQQEQLMEELVQTLEAEGFRGISNEELADALSSVEQRLLTEQHSGMTELGDAFDLNLTEVSTALTTDFEAGLQTIEASQIAPLREAIANQPDPVIHQHVTREVTEVQNVTNVTRVREGDQVIDQSTVNNVAEGGTLEIHDERVAVQADDGAVATGAGIEDSAVNTGNVDGVQAAGDVDAENSIIGDDNALLVDNEFDALAIGGDATSVEAGGNANVGGTQVDVDAGGDANAIIGSENDVAGDQTATVNSSQPIVGDPAPEVDPDPAADLHDELVDEGAAVEESFDEEIAAEQAAADDLEAELEA